MIDPFRWRARALALEAELQQADATIEVLKGALAAEIVEAINVPLWAEYLTPQLRALMGALVARYPRYMSREAISACIPHRDHTLDESLQTVSVNVCCIRRALGPGAVETLRGAGYRASPAFMARIAEPAHAQS